MATVAVRDVFVVVVIIRLVFILTFGRTDDIVQIPQQQTQPHRGLPADIYYTLLGREVISRSRTLLFFLVLTFVDLFFGCCRDIKIAKAGTSCVATYVRYKSAEIYFGRQICNPLRNRQPFHGSDTRRRRRIQNAFSFFKEVSRTCPIHFTRVNVKRKPRILHNSQED